jgi:uncharacterized repeat protein (TIGR01451 family)
MNPDKPANAGMFRGSNMLLAISFLLLNICGGAAAQTTYSWTGAASNLWSNQNNWTPIGVPVNGDSLVFPSGPTTLSVQNDLPAGRSFERINLNGDNYLVAGNALAVRTQLQALGRNARFNFVVDVPAGRTVDIGSVPPPGGGAPLHLSLGISGTGTVNVPVGAQLRLAGMSAYTGSFCPGTCGLVWLDGAQIPGATVGAIGLRGNGRIGAATPASIQVGSSVDLLSWLATGNARLESGALTLNNTALTLSFDGTAAGSTHDQLTVTGAVAINNSTLNLTSATSYLPSVGHALVLIDNDGVDAVTGTFNARAEASTFVANGATWRISYIGGSGNDVVITCLDAPRIWTGAVNTLWSNAGNWTGGVPASGDSIRFPAGASNQATVNDLAAGRTIRNITIEAAGYSLSGNGINLTGDVSANANVTLALPINVAAATTVNFAHSIFQGAIDVSGALTGSGTIRFVTSGFTRISGTHAFSGTLNPNCAPSCGILMLANASLPAATVLNNSNVFGSGQVGAVNSSGLRHMTITAADFVPNAIQPISTGVLRTGNLVLVDTRLALDLNGTVAGTEHDQISVAGSVSLGGSIYSIDLRLGDGFAPTVGHAYRIIDNDGADAISGIFAGLPEGALVYADGAEFTITYVGGTGNDVALVCTRSRKIWTGAVDANWSVPGNWIGGVPANGDSAAFPPNASRLTTINDLPAGRSLRNLWMQGPNYQHSGNAIALTRLLDVDTAREISLPINLASNDVIVQVNNGQYIQSGLFSGSGSLMLLGQVQRFRGVHSFSGSLQIPFTTALRGSLWLDDASLTAASTTLGGNLYGRGSLGALVSQGQIAPGNTGSSFGNNDGGRIATGSLQLQSGGILHAELDGVVPGTSHDLLDVTGTVTIGSGAAFSLTQSNAYVPALGQKYLIIANDGNDAIVGTFNGLAEAAVVIVGGYQFRASYVGGTGNDFELTSLNGKPPTTTVVSSSFNPSGQGQSVNLQATVTGTGATPTGSVVFRDGATTLGTVSLSGGVATLATSALTVGVHTITAEYFGDASFGGGVSAPLQQTVLNRYTLSYTAGSGGSLTGSTVQVVTVGGSGSPVTAVAAVGHDFVGWSDGVTANPRTDGPVSGPISVTANFQIRSYTVTPSAGTGGSILPATPRQVNHGATEVFTATPSQGYRLDSLAGCGGSAVGGSLTTAPVTAACNVAAAFNRTPTASASSLSLNEDAANADGNLVASDDDPLTYSVVSAPAKGTLTILNATTGAYRYVPNANANGADSFTFRVSDDAEFSTAATVSLTIAPINDPPSLTLAALPPHAAGASGVQQRPGFASFDAGPSNEDTTQTVLAYDIISVTDASGVVQGGSISIANNGQLAYTLTGVGGTATVSARVRDSGGTALGGIDTSTPKQFDIVVAPGADLQVALSNRQDTLVDGQITLYAIVVANAGPNAANGATVSNPLPATLINGMFACDAANSSVPCPPACTGSGNLSCAVNLPVNAFLRIDVMATVQGPLGALVRNEAAIAPPVGLTALNTANDLAVDQDVIVPDGVFKDGFGPVAGSSLTVPGAARALDAR